MSSMLSLKIVCQCLQDVCCFMEMCCIFSQKIATKFCVKAYEMYVAGYQFLVLNNLFMNHWGLQVFVTSISNQIYFDFPTQRETFSEKGDATTMEADATLAQQQTLQGWNNFFWTCPPIIWAAHNKNQDQCKAIANQFRTTSDPVCYMLYINEKGMMSTIIYMIYIYIRWWQIQRKRQVQTKFQEECVNDRKT